MCSVEQMIEDMRPHLLGIHHTQLDKIVRLSGLNPWIVDWVKILYDGPYQEIVKVLKMVSATTWTYYEIMNILDQPEIHLLKQAKLYLTKVWRETYPWSKKNVQSETTQSVSGGVPCYRDLDGIQGFAEDQQS